MNAPNTLKMPITALHEGRHDDPFGFLGPHNVGEETVVRTFQPGAEGVDLLSRDGKKIAAMEE